LSKYTEPLAHPAATYLSFYRAPAQFFYRTNIYKINKRAPVATTSSLKRKENKTRFNDQANIA